MPQFELRLFASFDLRKDGEVESLPTRRSEVLLAFLALNDGRPQTRERLAGLFWEDREDAQARTSLRQAVYQLRSVFGDTIDAGLRTIGLSMDAVWCDALELEKAPGDDFDRLARACDLYAGDLLAGFQPRDSELERWLSGERNRFRRVALDRLRRLAGQLRDRHRFAEMEAAARKGQAIEPYDEEACRLLMTACALQGRRTAALDAFRALSRLLREELSTAPEPETVDLFQSIRSRKLAPPEKSAPDLPVPPAPGVPSAPVAGPALPERRQVTALHLRFPALAERLLAADPEIASTAADAALGRAREILGRSGGLVHLAQGAEIAAVFGLDGGAEDHAVRALRAALDLRDTAGGDAGDPAIGIQFGETVTGGETGPGPVALVAGRLAVAAEGGETLAGLAAQQASAGFFRFSKPRPIGVPGLPSPLVAARLLGSTGARSRWEAAAGRPSSGFTGRAFEMETMRRAWSKIGSPAQFVVLSGEAGIGKSRLLHEFLKTVRRDGASVLRANLAPEDAEAPFRAVAILLRAWAGVEPADPAGLAGQKTETALERAGIAHLPATAAIRFLMGASGDGARWENLGAVEKRRQLAEAVRLVLEAAARDGPLAVVIDDVHWMDPETHAVFDRLVDNLGTSPVLVALACRPEFQHRWNGKSHVTQIALDVLTAQDTAALAAGLAGAEPFAPELAAAMHERTGGVPLFIEEVVRDLEETGALGEAGGPFAGLDQPGLPITVRGVIATRIDRLTAEQKALLQTASVIGTGITEDLLADLSGLAPEHLDDHLDALAEAGLLLRGGAERDGGRVFRHALIRDTAYQGILKERRRELHATLVPLLERHADGRQSAMADMIGRHAELGEMWPQAHRHLRAAGDQAHNLSAYSQARALYERAAQALARLPETAQTRSDAIRIRLRLRPVLLMTGENRALGSYLREAEDTARELGDPVLLVRTLIHKSYFLSTLGHLRDAEATAAEASRAARSTGDAFLQAESTLARAQAVRLQGKPVAVVSMLRPALDFWTRDNRHLRSDHFGTRSIWFLGHLAVATAMTGETGEALRLIGECVAIADETTRPADMQYAAFTRAEIMLLAGDARGAVAEAERALAIVETAHLKAPAFWMQGALADAWLADGQVDRAVRLLSEAKQAVEDSEIEHYAANLVAIALAEGYRRQDRTDDAATLSRAVLDWCEKENAVQLGCRAMRCLAECLGATGEPEAALDLIGTAIAAANEHGLVLESAACHGVAAGLCEKTGDIPQARRHRAALAGCA